MTGRHHPSTKREQAHADKRERILNAATDLFYDRGFAGTTMEAIADQLSMTKPFIYYHFSNKKDLLVAVCERGFYEANSAIEKSISLSGTHTEKMLCFVDAFTQAILANRRNIAVMLREGHGMEGETQKTIQELNNRVVHQLRTLIQGGVSSGEFQVPDDLTACFAIVGIMGWAYSWYDPSGRLSAEIVTQHFQQMVLRILGADAPDFGTVAL